jgi:hypothetical protein
MQVLKLHLLLLNFVEHRLVLEFQLIELLFRVWCLLGLRRFTTKHFVK